MSPKTGNQPLVYDENLLAQAPEVTQGQRQEGYDADILNPSPPPASRTPGPSQPYRDHPDVESGSSAHDKHLAAGGYDHFGQTTKKPFWKTPKGLIIMAVIALAVIAAVVGGAVGGTVNKNKGSSGNNSSDGVGAGNGNESATGIAPTSTNTAQTPTETGGGGDTPGGGGSSLSTTRHDGASPTQTTPTSQSSTTTASITTPGVEPPSQPGAGDGAGSST
ncbi:unnamed protein product [Rhizoctonia solani]|uniref:Uncharacterized protein n=1 Tax=Rhizoctonia solani TaxID=456999 RepID=A0A8H3HS73_9AGAM|nr:unnamed protein product [Rhizoctonia solani]